MVVPLANMHAYDFKQYQARAGYALEVERGVETVGYMKDWLNDIKRRYKPRSDNYSLLSKLLDVKSSESQKNFGAFITLLKESVAVGLDKDADEINRPEIDAIFTTMHYHDILTEIMAIVYEIHSRGNFVSDPDEVDPKLQFMVDAGLTAKYVSSDDYREYIRFKKLEYSQITKAE
jgi:hypothetical protein